MVNQGQVPAARLQSTAATRKFHHHRPPVHTLTTHRCRHGCLSKLMRAVFEEPKRKRHTLAGYSSLQMTIRGWVGYTVIRSISLFCATLELLYSLVKWSNNTIRFWRGRFVIIIVHVLQRKIHRTFRFWRKIHTLRTQLARGRDGECGQLSELIMQGTP